MLLILKEAVDLCCTAAVDVGGERRDIWVSVKLHPACLSFGIQLIRT